MSFLKQKVSFSSKLGSLYSVMSDHYFVLFQLKLYMLLTKVAYQSAKCQTCNNCSLALKLTKSIMLFLQPRISFSSNFASLFSVMRHNSSVFFHLNLCMFWRKEPIKVQISRLSTARMKLKQISYVIFQDTSQFSLNFASPFSVLTHNSSEIF